TLVPISTWREAVEEAAIENCIVWRNALTPTRRTTLRAPAFRVIITGRMLCLGAAARGNSARSSITGWEPSRVTEFRDAQWSSFRAMHFARTPGWRRRVPIRTDRTPRAEVCAVHLGALAGAPGDPHLRVVTSPWRILSEEGGRYRAPLEKYESLLKA